MGRRCPEPPQDSTDGHIGPPSLASCTDTSGCASWLGSGDGVASDGTPSLARPGIQK